MTPSQFGTRIRALREKLSLSQEQLAEKVGISHSHLSMIERGDRTPHVETLVLLAKALGIAVSQLLRDANEPRERTGQPPDLRLMTYLGTLRLTSGDVNRLVAIAKAMFAGKSRFENLDPFAENLDGLFKQLNLTSSSGVG